MKKRFYRLAYYCQKKSEHKQGLHELRDGDPFSDLSLLLREKGYEYTELLLNRPEEQKWKDEPMFVSSDVVVMTTRPPLNDYDQVTARPRTKIDGGNTRVKDFLHGRLKTYFAYCDRSQVKLRDELRDMIGSAESKEWADLSFNQQTQFADIKTINGHKSRKFSTALYFLFTREVKNSSVENLQTPRILLSFGMGGQESLIWAYLIRKRYWNEWRLDQPRLLVAEAINPHIPDDSMTLSFSLKWQIEKRIDIPLGD